MIEVEDRLAAVIAKNAADPDSIDYADALLVALVIADECQKEVMDLRKQLEDLQYTVRHLVEQVGVGDGR